MLSDALRETTDLLPLATVTLDRTGNVTGWNEAAERMIGWSAAEAIGRPAPFVPEERRAQFEAMHRAAFETDGPLADLTVRRLRKDGTPMDVLVARARVRDASGAVVALVGQLVDVTAERVAAAERERFDAHTLALFEHSGEALLVYDGHAIRYANPRLLGMLGYTHADELIGLPALSIVHPEEVERIRARIDRVTNEAQMTPPLRQRLLRKDGTPVVVEAWGLATMFRGRPAGLTHFRDLTVTLELEARVRAADRMATIGRLAAVIGHEINNPLAYVLGNLEALGAGLRRGADPRTLTALVDAAADGAGRVRRIVGDLRVFSRAGGDERVPVDLVRVLDSCARMATNEIRHRARLVLDHAGAPSVLGSEARLGQVFLNLLVNAAQAIPEGDAAANTVTVRARSEGARVRVELVDTGVGIDAALLPQIFDPFVTTKDDGTGLGLSICRSLLDEMGGSIEIESTLGRGTTVRVWLESAGVDARTPVPEPEPPPSARRRRILVVDDEPRLAGVIGLLLADHDTTIAYSGRQALEQLERDPSFDVVLCDLMMPDLSGMALYDHLRAHRPGVEGRMVFMTGGAFTPRASEFLARVPNLRLEKPFDGAALLAAIDAAVR